MPKSEEVISIMETKTIVLSGGGTAGHIYPAIALADELQSRGYNILYAGTPQGVESSIVPNAGYEFKSFNVCGFDRQKPWTGLTALHKLYKAKKQAIAWLNEKQPACCVGFGGYVSVPVMEAARTLGIKTCIHEQNSHMGVANFECAKFADRVCLTYSEAAQKLKCQSKVVLTGNPVRKEILSGSRSAGRKLLNIDENKLVLLVFGGSLGATHLNNAFLNLAERFLQDNEQLYIVHISGKKDFENCSGIATNFTDEVKARYKLIDYCTDMPLIMAACDCIISRAGATSLTEISARKIPALLVPFPYATANHQEKNAEAYVKAGAANLIKDENLDSPEFQKLCQSLIEDSALRDSMHKAAEKFKTEDAVGRLTDVVETLVK